MNKDRSILTTFYFLAGLTVLILNDFLLKERFGNWVTGKLSDFAGLLVFPLFWTFLFPKQKIKIFFLTGLLFMFWKSPFSEPMIEAWNSLGIFSLGRTIDYSDFIALIMLPIAFKLDNIKEKLLKFRMTPLVPLVLASFAFIATSKMPKRPRCFINNPAVFHVKHFSRDSLIGDLKKSGLKIRFSKYLESKYDDEHSEIEGLDTIKNLVVLIHDFNPKDNTVEISLGCWDFKDKPSRELTEDEWKREKEYIKRIFMDSVVRKIEKPNIGEN